MSNRIRGAEAPARPTPTRGSTQPAKKGGYGTRFSVSQRGEVGPRTMMPQFAVSFSLAHGVGEGRGEGLYSLFFFSAFLRRPDVAAGQGADDHHHGCIPRRIP